MDYERNEFIPLPEDDTQAEAIKKALEGKASAKMAELFGMGAAVAMPTQTLDVLWTIGERVQIKGYWFEVVDIGKDRVTLKPSGPTQVEGP